MSSSSNPVRRFNEEVSTHWSPALFDEYFTPDYVNHGNTPSEDSGREEQRQFFIDLKAAFPDMYFSVDDVVTEGDKVAARGTMRGTHRGEIFGAAPTGKQVTWYWMVICRVADGKIVEQWAGGDGLGFLQQLGLMPPFGQTGG